MKHVFKTEEVPHIWAQQKQSDGRNPQGNLYFEGATIYSYGGHFPIATFAQPDLVLITTRGYSSTTNKQVHAVRYAINHIPKRFNVYDPTAAQYPSRHAANLVDLIQAFSPAQKAAVKSRKYFDVRRCELEVAIEHAFNYAATFKSHLPANLKADVKKWQRKLKAGKLFSGKELEQLKRQIAGERVANTARNKARRERLASEAAERMQKQLKNLERWLAGEVVHISELPTDRVRLRIIGEEIETSRGASVPLSAARTLWDRMVKGEPLHGLDLGNYTVTAANEQNLIVGCHTIPLKEIYKTAKRLKWFQGEVTE